MLNQHGNLVEQVNSALCGCVEYGAEIDVLTETGVLAPKCCGQMPISSAHRVFLDEKGDVIPPCTVGLIRSKGMKRWNEHGVGLAVAA